MQRLLIPYPASRLSHYHRTMHIRWSRYCETILVTQEAVLVTHITHLGKFTVMPAETPELCQPIQISVYLKASQPMEIARIFLIIPAPSWGGAEGTDPFPTLKLTRYKGKKQGGGGGRSRGVTWRRGIYKQTVLLRSLQKADVEVPRCPWHLTTLALQA